VKTEEACYDELQVQMEIIVTIRQEATCAGGEHRCGKDISGAGTVARATGQSINHEREMETWGWCWR
jgi:hypothetical protein